jgi:hypothetical protein
MTASVSIPGVDDHEAATQVVVVSGFAPDSVG